MAKKPVKSADPVTEDANLDHGQATPAVGPRPSIPRRCLDAIAAGDDDSLKATAIEYLRNLIASYPSITQSVLILYDMESISDFHADRLYAAASEKDLAGKPVLLILHSLGGAIEPAYLISKALKRLSHNHFIVAIPRRAKSAATLLALGANEVHMGLMSQLGPIDPQISGLPALALANALDVIAEVACRFPAAHDMFTKYLAEQIPIRHLGYFQRLNDSAAQYAERLLSDKTLPEGQNAEFIAKHLVNYYKDHGFVIDVDEARQLLGSDFIKEGTDAYKLADDIFKFLDFLDLFLDEHGKRLLWVGSLSEGPRIWSKAPSQAQGSVAR